MISLVNACKSVCRTTSVAPRFTSPASRLVSMMSIPSISNYSLKGVYKVKEEFPCSCGRQISEVVRIGSRRTGQEIKVCRGFANQFPSLTPPIGFQKEIIQSLFLLKENQMKKVCPALISWAYGQGAIQFPDYFFYLSQRRDLPPVMVEPWAKIEWVNRLILLEFSWTPQQALQSLKEDFENRTAGRALLELAEKQGVISADEKNVYLRFWNRQELNEGEYATRAVVNCNIINRLKI